MAGIYIHIPFCRSRCIYCGFYSTTALDLRQRYVDALCREMEIRGTGHLISGQSPDQGPVPPISTIYLGGGTPSQLTFDQLHQLFIYINKVYPLTSKKEITIEVNPDDVTTEYAVMLSQLGINRVSMGAQTFDDERLRFLHRRHTAAQVPLAVQRLRDAGIQNISVDLMYGFPDETLQDWEYDIDAALRLHVEHLSAYCLMIEEGTPLWRLKMKNEKIKMDEETERLMYERLIDKVTETGYEHYEISNFAISGWVPLPTAMTGTPAVGISATSNSIWKLSKGDSYPVNKKSSTRILIITTASLLPSVLVRDSTSPLSPISIVLIAREKHNDISPWDY